jgi:hypothetical protein
MTIGGIILAWLFLDLVGAPFAVRLLNRSRR